MTRQRRKKPVWAMRTPTFTWPQWTDSRPESRASENGLCDRRRCMAATLRAAQTFQVWHWTPRPTRPLYSPPQSRPPPTHPMRTSCTNKIPSMPLPKRPNFRPPLTLCELIWTMWSNRRRRSVTKNKINLRLK